MDKSADCLILRIDEHQLNGSTFNTNHMYVLYDANASHFLIRGVSYDIPFSFKARYNRNVRQFVECVTNSNSTLYYSLYNYPDLPTSSDKITYDYLSELSDDYALSLDKTSNTVSLKSMISLVQNVFNYY
jgi:hypothetical protein